jgi:hypothetical protein
MRAERIGTHRSLSGFSVPVTTTADQTNNPPKMIRNMLSQEAHHRGIASVSRPILPFDRSSPRKTEEVWAVTRPGQSAISKKHDAKRKRDAILALVMYTVSTAGTVIELG